MDEACRGAISLLLAGTDSALRGWLERGFDLYGGFGRDPRMRPLFE